MRYTSNGGCLACCQRRGRSKDRAWMDYPELKKTRWDAHLAGDEWYFDGVACEHRHRCPKHTSSNWCKACVTWGYYPAYVLDRPAPIQPPK